MATDFVDRLVRAAKFARVGESQSRIALALGVSKQRVNKWFTGGHEPNAEQTLEIAKRFNVSAEWLKSGEGEMTAVPDGLSQEERDLIKSYRSATPQVRNVISTMARAVRKSVVAVAFAIPPLLAPKQAESAILHNVFSRLSAGLNTQCMRWLLGVVRKMMPSSSESMMCSSYR